MPEPLSVQRQRLAERAAAAALSGHADGAMLPCLRRLSSAELLRPACPRHTCDLAAEAAAVLAAAEAAVRRRPGWLTVCLPPAPLPVRLRPRLLQAALLAVLGGALQAQVPALVGGAADRQGLSLWLRGGQPSDAPALWRQLAGEAGGVALVGAGSPCVLAVRLPFASTPIHKTAGGAEALLADRYSLLYQYLGRYCARPEPF